MLNTRDEALALLRQYNKEPFHLLHALTVEGVMAWYAGELGYGDQADFWSMAGLLHDIDFEQWPDQHCRKAPELLREAGAEVLGVVSIFTYGMKKGLERLAAAGVRNVSHIRPEDVARLLAFRDNPSDESWMKGGK